MDNPTITLSVSGDASANLTIGENAIVALSVDTSAIDGGVPYDGPYTVRPSPNSQTLPTAQRRMRYDMEIEEIPYYKTTNEAGGYTAIIGD